MSCSPSLGLSTLRSNHSRQKAEKIKPTGQGFPFFVLVLTVYIKEGGQTASKTYQSKRIKKAQPKPSMRKNITLFTIIGSLIALSVSGVYVSSCKEEPRPKTQQAPNTSIKRCKDCNVVLISVDTLRADQLGLYREAGFSSPCPNIDKFFGQGTVYERAYASSPCTSPSILQFLTGTFNEKPNVPRLRIAQILKDIGYQTAGFVSQRLLGTAEKPKSEYTLGFDHYDIQDPEQIDKNKLSSRTAEEVTDNALAWLEKNGTRKKFFMWTHYFDPHDPYSPPDIYTSSDTRFSRIHDGERRMLMQKAKMDNPNYTGPTRWNIAATDEIRNTWRFYGHIFNSEEVRILKELHRNEISYTDVHVARLIDALKARGLIDNSIIIFTSDHGERLGEESIWDHCMSLHEREIHVPLAIVVRGKRLRNKDRVPHPVSTLDIAPTILSLLKHKTEAVFDGKNLNTKKKRGPVFAMWENEATLLSQDLKLYYQKQNYRMAKPLEANEEEPLVLDRQNDTHVTLLKTLKSFLIKNREAILQYELYLKQLRGLGYID